MYRSTPENFPATFLVGDVLDDAFLPSGKILTKAPETPCPDFHSLTSFRPLTGRVSVIYIARFFHLFNEGEQVEVACKLASLLSPELGSTIFGTHIGSPERPPMNCSDTPMVFFRHSPESWRELWEDKVFAGRPVKLDATVSRVSEQSRHMSRSDEHLLTWSVVML